MPGMMINERRVRREDAISRMGSLSFLDARLFLSCALCLCGLIHSPASIAQDAPPPASLSASLTPAEIPFHRTATYTLRIEAPAGEQFEFPDLSSANPDFSIRRGELRSSVVEDSQVIEQDYVLDAVRPGAYLMPGQQLTIAGQALSVPPLALSVRDLTESELAAAGEFEGLPGLDVVVPQPGTPWWYYALGAAALGLLAALVAYLWAARRREAPMAPPDPAWVVAERRLNELASRQLPQGGKFEAYYVDLSAILRYYIEDRFGIRAPEQTTPEFLESASGSGRLTDAQQEALSRFLRHCDRVKFARYEPSLAEMEESFGVVTGFVRETIPQLEPEARNAA